MNPGIENKAVERLIIFILMLTTFILIGARTLICYFPSNIMMDHFISLTAFCNFVIAIIVVKWLYTVKYLGTELDTQKHRLNYMEDAMKIMRSERHEYLNHMQTIMGLIMSGDHKEAMTYLKDMGAECRFNSQVLSVSNPALRVLLQNKRQSALSKGIELKLTIQSDLKLLQLSATDITTIFGNLLDNAMDCIVNAKNSNNRKLIHLKVTEVADDYVFTIEDSGPPIEPNILAEIFKMGFSTKGTGRGFGLALVENTIQRYQGTIHYGVNGAKGFTVTFPQQGVAA